MLALERMVELLTKVEGKRKAMATYKHTNSKGVTYFLNSKAVVLRGGKEQTIYYFSKDDRAETGLAALPDGMQVNENPRNGFLTVSRIK